MRKLLKPINSNKITQTKAKMKYQHVIATQHHQKIFKKIKRVVIIPNRRMKKTIQTPRSNNKIKRQKLSPKPVLNKKYKRKRITMQTQI